MILMAIIIGCIIGAIIGVNIPTIPYTYSGYLAIAIIAALDSVFGAITSSLNKNFDMKIFVSGFFVNAILAMALTYLGQKLNIDIYLEIREKTKEFSEKIRYGEGLKLYDYEKLIIGIWPNISNYPSACSLIAKSLLDKDVFNLIAE